MPPKFEPHEVFQDTPGASSTSGDPTSEEIGAEGYKKKGNEAFANKDWDEAIKQYNKAVSLNPDQASFYSNRAACWASKGQHSNALADAERCVKADPKFVKGYSRKGKALFDLGRWEEAEAAYNKGLEIEVSNEACLSGAKLAHARLEASRRPQSSGSSSSAFSGVTSFFKSMMEKLSQGGGGGAVSNKLKFYGVMMVGYFLYTNFVVNKTSKKQQSSTQFETQAEDDDSDVAAGHMRRTFAEVKGGTWISYLEVPASSDTHFLLLHGTTSSAAADFGGVLSAFAEGGSAESSRLSLLAPDRPCHGYSPCAQGAEGANVAWLNALLSSRPKASRLAIIASGPTAARQALALSKKRKEVEHLLLLNQRSAASAARLDGASAIAADVGKWLDRGAFNALAASKPSAAVAADTLWWATRAGGDKEQESADTLDVSDVPDRCSVTVFHGREAGEDTELKAAFEEQAVTVTMRDYGDIDDLLEELVAEFQHIASSSGSSGDDEKIGHQEG